MKSVEIELLNIQCHQHTVFSLKPGLNFILSNDNNVGKSTIFKVLTFISKMPNVTGQDSSELLRVGEQRGYASFKFDDKHIVLWIFKDGDKMRTFFEINDADGVVTRAVSCPAKLLEALDIIRGDDGTPINFNDADSVQLVVQDTPKNDEVLSRVLVDVKVEAIKQNMHQLSKQIVQDYRYATHNLEDVDMLVSTLQYNSDVDLFNEEKSMLNVLVQVVDSMSEGCAGIGKGTEKLYPSLEELTMLSRLMEVYSVLSSLTFESICANVPNISEDKPCMSAALGLLGELVRVDLSVIGKSNILPSSIISNMQRGLDVLSKLNSILYSVEKVCKFSSDLDRNFKEQRDIYMELNRECEIIECPVKGSVYFSDEKCIPTDN